MRVLFALDPWIYRDRVGNQFYTLETIFAPAINALMKYGHDLKLLLGEDMLECIKLKPLDISCDTVKISLNELYNVYTNHSEAHLLQHENRSTATQVSLFKELLSKSLGRWYPDVIIAFTTPVSIWKKCYPKSLAMQFENGIFSRSPYPYLCQLDPFGFLSRSYPYIFRNALIEQTISSVEIEKMLWLRESYIDKIFRPYNPLNKEDLIDFEGQKSLLVPLSYNGVVINDAASIYKSQLDFLLHIMYRVPESILVFYTNHSLQIVGGIPEETQNYLTRRFPNLRYHEEFDRYAFCSQWLTPLVDAIISLNSTVAYHAAFWGKKVFALGECEINTVSTSNHLDDIENDLATVWNFDHRAYNVLYHLLTRYCFSLKSFHDPAWLTERFEKLFWSKEKGILETDYRGMPILDDEDKIFNSLLDESPAVQEGYQVRVRD